MNSVPVVYPPNRPLERILLPPKTPTLHKFIFFLDANDKGELLVGSSSITDALWGSSLFYYKEPTLINNNQYSSYYLGAASSPDGKFLKDNQVIAAEDNSCIKLLTFSNEESAICENILKTCGRVERLSVWNNSDKILACAENVIITGDLGSNSTDPIQEYKNFHTGLVTSVDVNQNKENIFASVSCDRKACVWDIRTQTVVSLLYQNEFCSLTSVAWNPSQPDELVVGSEAGVVYSLDMRQPKEFLKNYTCFNASVYRIAFNTSGCFAVCGNVPDIVVCNRDLSVVYSSSEHTDIVRGLTWCNDTLYSAGFDKQVIKHVF